MHFAYAANAGTTRSPQYFIDSFTGTLTAFGTPVATGKSPYAITGSPDRQHVYVVNQVSNDISAYAVNATSGALTPIAGSPFAAGTDPQALAFDPSGAYLYVADHDARIICRHTRLMPAAGAFTPLSPRPTPQAPVPPPLLLIPLESLYFVANDGGTERHLRVCHHGRDGALTPVAGSPLRRWQPPRFVDELCQFPSIVYAANTGGATSTISAFSLNPSTGALAAMAGSPFDLAVSHYMGVYRAYGDSLFVTTGDSVAGYYIDSVTGLLTAAPGTAAAAGVNAYSVTIVNARISFLYVGNDGSANISAYKIDIFGDVLTAVPGSPIAAGNNPDFISRYFEFEADSPSAAGTPAREFVLVVEDLAERADLDSLHGRSMIAQ